MKLYDLKKAFCDSGNITSLHGQGTKVVVEQKDGSKVVGEFRTEERAEAFVTNVKRLADRDWETECFL